MKLLGPFVVPVDHAGIEPRQLDRARDDGRQNRFEIQRRADRLPDLAQGGELLHRARQRVRARVQLLEEAHVLDGDDRLVGERHEQ